MGRSARPLEEAEPWSLADGAASLLGLIARNPTLVGGSTAFLVALSFVSANALWYQPHAHSGAFFATRDFLRPGVPEEIPQETTIIIERPEAAARPVEGDPTLKAVQETLKSLNFYAGEVDGLYGPNTRQAIAAYQSKMGLAATGAVDDALLDQLGTGSITPPPPQPRPALVQPVSATTTSAPAPARDDLTAKVQAGLRGQDEVGDPRIPVAVRPAADRRRRPGGLRQDEGNRAGEMTPAALDRSCLTELFPSRRKTL